MPPSSLYCCQKSVSRVSSAARNRRMAASPGVRPPLALSAKAGTPAANSPAPTVPAAPTASPLRKKERRLLACCECCSVCAMIFPFCVCLCVLCHDLLLIMALVSHHRSGNELSPRKFIREQVTPVPQLK